MHKRFYFRGVLPSLFLCVGLAAMPTLSSAQSSQSLHQQERAACQASGQQGESLQACLRDADAAQQERLRQQRDPLQSTDERQGNTLNRCARLPADQQAECRAMMQRQPADGSVRTQGSVQGGGVLREMTIPQTR